MNARLVLMLALALAAGGCGSRTTPEDRPKAQAENPKAVENPPATPAFAGKTWRVVESTSGTKDSRYEFRSDGVLVMTGPGSTPAEGKWTWDNGVLTMIEEGIPYRIDILALDDSTFRIRSNNPGTPVEMTLVRD